MESFLAWLGRKTLTKRWGVSIGQPYETKRHDRRGGGGGLCVWGVVLGWLWGLGVVFELVVVGFLSLGSGLGRFTNRLDQPNLSRIKVRAPRPRTKLSFFYTPMRGRGQAYLGAEGRKDSTQLTAVEMGDWYNPDCSVDCNRGRGGTLGWNFSWEGRGTGLKTDVKITELTTEGIKKGLKQGCARSITIDHE